MSQLLKQSTSYTFRIGPFVDDADGKTAETALTITQADVQLSKAGGAFAQKNDTGSATHDVSGWYYLTLNTTDTGTLGTLTVMIAESGALPVWKDFMVVPANVYDSLVGGTDTLQADVTQWTGTNVATPDTAGYPKVTIKSGTGTGEINLASGVADTDVKKWTGTAVATPDTAGYPKTTIKSGTGTGEISLASGQVTVGTLAAAALASIWDRLTSALTTVGSIGKLLVDNVDATISSRASQTSVNTIDDFVDTEVGAIKGVTDKLDTAMELDGAVYRFTTNALEQAPTGGSAPTAAQIADAVWDEAKADHTAVGSFGEEEQAHALSSEIPTPPTAAAIADQVWDEAKADHTAVGSFGEEEQAHALSSEIPTVSAIADQVWDEVMSGHSGGGSSGNFMTAMASRLPTSFIMGSSVPDSMNDEINAIKTKTDNLPASPAAVSDIPTAAQNADAVWDELAADHNIADTYGPIIELIDSRTTDIKAKTDNLPASPAAVSDIPTYVQNADAVWNYLTTEAVQMDSYGQNLRDEWGSKMALLYTDWINGGRLDLLVDAIKAKTDTIPANPTSTSDIPSASTIAAAVWSYVVEGSLTALNVIRIALAVLAGKSTGGGTSTFKFRDNANSKDRVSATVDINGNRTSVSLDGS